MWDYELRSVRSYSGLFKALKTSINVGPKLQIICNRSKVSYPPPPPHYLLVLTHVGPIDFQDEFYISCTIQNITLIMNNRTKRKRMNGKRAHPNINNTLLLKNYQKNIISSWKKFIKIISLLRVHDFGGDMRNKLKKLINFYGSLFFDLLCLPLCCSFLSGTVIKC
jgi:hypothetical protein